MTTESLVILSLLFFIVALIYSSVGFGGGSSYLALLVLFHVSYLELKTIALICNVIVVSSNIWIFNRNGVLQFKKSFQLCLISIPFAFLGGLYDLNNQYFFYLLGTSLLAAAVLLMIGINVNFSIKNHNSVAYTSSAGLGFLSGLVGIGGGIFLSPILNLINWDTSKKIAATASLFILINSVAGLSGHLVRFSEIEVKWHFIVPLFIAVFIGSQVGARITLQLNYYYIKLLTAALVFIAGIKILTDHL